jgi:ATP/ADP translocase
VVNSEKAIGWLRWVCVLPAAVLASIAVQFIAGMVGRLAIFAGASSADSTFVYYLLLLLLYIPKEAAFVVAGAKMAPQGRFVTAVVLVVVRVLMSLIVHIVGQTNPGVVNYTHFAVESTGSGLGLACIKSLGAGATKG